MRAGSREALPLKTKRHFCTPLAQFHRRDQDDEMTEKTRLYNNLFLTIQVRRLLAISE